MNKKDRGKRGFSKNPWKHIEPGIKTTEKEFNKQNKSMKERIQMEKPRQIVEIFPHKFLGLFATKKYKRFTIVVSVPLQKQAFYKRMRLAFPGCIWKGEK